MYDSPFANNVSQYIPKNLTGYPHPFPKGVRNGLKSEITAFRPWPLTYSPPSDEKLHKQLVILGALNAIQCITCHGLATLLKYKYESSRFTRDVHPQPIYFGMLVYK